MRTLLPTLLLTGAAAVALAGCNSHWTDSDEGGGHGPMKMVSTLQCPDHEGSLTRVRVAPDGLSCDYAGPRGSEVVLELVKLENGDTGATLASLDSQMDGLMPGVRERVEEGSAKAADDESDGSETTAASSGKSREKVNIDLPLFHIHTQGDRAQIRMPGINIDADDRDKKAGSSEHGNARVSIGGGQVEVLAHNDAAVVKVRERGAGVRASYRLADKSSSASGWRMVGYEARGPAGGPVVVAVVKSKDDDEDPLFHDARRLVRANVGG